MGIIRSITIIPFLCIIVHGIIPIVFTTYQLISSQVTGENRTGKLRVITSFFTYFGGKVLEHYFPVLLPLEYPGDLITEYNLVKPYDLRVRDEEFYVVTAKDGVDNRLRRYKLRGREHLAPVLLVSVGAETAHLFTTYSSNVYRILHCYANSLFILFFRFTEQQ